MKADLKKNFFILNLVIFAGAMACLVFYDYHGGLWLKGVTSLWFCWESNSCSVKPAV